MTTARVLETLAQSRANIDLLYAMPALAEWELEVRVNAIRAHAAKICGDWLRKQGVTHEVRVFSCSISSACRVHLDSIGVELE
jgi:hypothetical protein